MDKDIRNETERTNNLICEFMRWRYRFVEYPDPALSRWEVARHNDDYWTQIHYDSSWDWFMEAWHYFRVLKVEDNADGDGDNLHAVLAHNTHVELIGHSVGYEELSDAYNLLVMGIEWYNKLISK